MAMVDGAVRGKVCLTVVGNGIVRLCAGSLVGGAMANGAMVSGAMGRDVCLVFIDNGIVGLSVRLLVLPWDAMCASWLSVTALSDLASDCSSAGPWWSAGPWDAMCALMSCVNSVCRQRVIHGGEDRPKVQRNGVKNHCLWTLLYLLIGMCQISPHGNTQRQKWRIA